MTQVHPLSPQINREGSERLARALALALMTNADLSPRWPQIRALGLSLQQVSRDLEREVERMASRLDTTPEMEAFRDSLRQLAEAFSRLGSIAETYPSST